VKSFSHFITELNEGQNNAQFTGHLSELFTAVKAHGLAGALRITIKVLPATRGGGPVDKVLISCDSQLTLPKPTQPSDIFYLTDDAEPTRNHPRQMELGGLRDVTAEPTATDRFKDSTTDADGVIHFKEASK
jgi:hypothetical protein